MGVMPANLWLARNIKMKKLFAIIALLIFIAFCYGSAKEAAYVALPQYQEVTLDLLGGMTPLAWQKDPTAQNAHLRKLSAAAYQPTTKGLNLGSVKLAPDQVLTEQDFRTIIKENPSEARKLVVRDPGDILSMASMDLTLRDNIIDKKNNTILIKQGVTVDKKLIDAMLGMGLVKVRALGSGNMVAPLMGTMLMIVVIFLGLYCALRVVLFDPILVIMDERESEIEKGLETAQENHIAAQKLEEENLKLRKEARQAHLASLAADKHAVMKEADSILKDATVEAHRIRDNAHLEMREVVKKAEEELRKDIDVFAKDIVKQVLTVAGGKA